MFATGIIEHNISSYPNSTMLVKKKDEGPRFCVDYRALNKIIILSKFPILVIDD